VIGDDPIALRAGQQLVIPYDPVSDALKVELYRVQADDYRHGLTGIAQRHYGDPGLADRLYRVNRGVIGENPSQLQTGQLLILP
jgi:nucleoid-associated protein YgaU